FRFPVDVDGHGRRCLAEANSYRAEDRDPGGAILDPVTEQLASSVVASLNRPASWTEHHGQAKRRLPLHVHLQLKPRAVGADHLCEPKAQGWSDQKRLL